MGKTDANGALEGAEQEAAEVAEADQEELAREQADAAGDGSDGGSEDAGAEEADQADEDSLTYSNGVIEKIVAVAVREVPHVLGMKGNLLHFVQEQFGSESLTKGITVEVGEDDRVLITISVIVEYGAYVPKIFEDVKRVVTERLKQMTGLAVGGLNLRVEDVVTREEYEQSRKRFLDGLGQGGSDEDARAAQAPALEAADPQMDLAD